MFEKTQKSLNYNFVGLNSLGGRRGQPRLAQTTTYNSQGNFPSFKTVDLYREQNRHMNIQLKYIFK